MTEFISHTRTLGSHGGSVYIGYLRADELNKSRDLPRLVKWELYGETPMPLLRSEAL